MYERKFKVAIVGIHPSENPFGNFEERVQMNELGWFITRDSSGSTTIIKMNRISNPQNVYLCFMKQKPSKDIAYYERVWQLNRNIENGVMRHFCFDEVEQPQNANSTIFRCTAGKKVFYVVVEEQTQK